MKEVKRWLSLFLAFAMLMTVLSVNTMSAIAAVSWTGLWGGDGWAEGARSTASAVSATASATRVVAALSR